MTFERMFKIPVKKCLSSAGRGPMKTFLPGVGLHTTPAVHLKQIEANKVGDKLVIEGVYIDSPRKDYVVQNKSECCPLCSLNLNVKHTDVLILSQFVRPDGCMMPRRITGLCKTQQKRMSVMVSMAHKAGLMCSLAPENSKNDPTRRKDWKKYNTYFDESTILVYENHFTKMRKDMIKNYTKSIK